MGRALGELGLTRKSAQISQLPRRFATAAPGSLVKYLDFELRITDGRSWYNGLVLGANRRFSGGLSMQASYTLGKSIDYGSQAVGSGDFENSFQPATFVAR